MRTLLFFFLRLEGENYHFVSIHFNDDDNNGLSSLHATINDSLAMGR